MNHYNLILAEYGPPEFLAGLLAILSMVVARLLDWYFPSKHHRKLDEEIERQHKEEDYNE
jgi:hypothetical protein